MPQYKLCAISINLSADNVYEKKITVMTPEKIYRVLDFPDDKKLNHGQILKLIKDTFNCQPEDIIWPAHITIP